MISNLCNKVFQESIAEYHKHDDIDYVFTNPYPADSLEHLLYRKSWIDDAQWHMEDVIRNPDIAPEKALYWKRRIDVSNQERTDMVEYIDSYFLNKYKDVVPKPDAKINTESPAWAIDRLSILTLKIYHMQEEANRVDASAEHIEKCTQKLTVLLSQRNDLVLGIDELIEDIEKGNKYMKVYKQMKMYNDPNLNPVLYKK